MNAANPSTILIPAYNPDARLVELAAALRDRAFQILVVDDGSTTGCDVFQRLARDGFSVLRHTVNQGKGAALKTGLAWLAENHPETPVIVTADADGQHRPDDIARVAEEAVKHPQALTLGVRAFTGKVPFRSRFGNWWTRVFFFLSTGLWIRDTQTGLRGIPAALSERIRTLPGDRYEYEMAMLTDAKRHPAPPVQIPIETVYIAENASSHFSPLRDTIRIYRAMLSFCVASVGCFLLDNAVFTAVVYATKLETDWRRATRVLVALCLARAVSSTVNFYWNHALVFRSSISKRVAFPRYWLLVFLILGLGYAATSSLSFLLDAHDFWITAVKIIVETGLFVLSYAIQRRWVFPESPART
jgi:glycosyltransferase involved in cell wall biosynthesis